MKLSEFIAKIIPWINGLPHPGVKKSHERGFFHIFNNNVKNLFKNNGLWEIFGLFLIYSFNSVYVFVLCVCVYD